MKDEDKIKEQLISELVALRQRVAELEALETERKEAEDQLKVLSLVVEQSADSIAILDKEGTVEYVNPKLLELYEYSPEKVIGKPWRSFVSMHSTLREKIQAIRDTVIKRGMVWRGEVTDRAKSGEVIWRAAKIFPIKDEKGEIAHSIYISEDITERKRAEEALRQSEERYRTLFDGVPVGLYRSTPAGQFLDANPAMVQMLGYPDREALLAVDAADLYVDPEDRCRWRTLMEAEGIVRNFEAQFRRRDGTIIWARDSARVVRDSGDRVLYYEGSLEDITERKQAEEALRESEEKYRSLVENSIDGIAIVQGPEIRFVNRALLKMFGCQSEDEMVGCTFTDFVSPRHRSLMMERACAREKGEDVPGSYEFKARRKDGTEFDAEISISVIAYEGRPARQGVVRDVTERKRAEEVLAQERERMSTILSSLDTGLSLINSDKTIAWVNEKIREMFPDGEPIGQVCHVFYESREEPCDTCATLPVFKTGNVNEMERFNPANGRWYHIVSQPVKDETGHVVNVLEGITDITERKRLEEQLRQSQKMEAVGRLAGGVAHDFNNLLTAITGYSELLLQNLADHHPLREDIEAIKKAGERAASLTRQLLAFSRRQTLQPQVLDLNATVADVKKMLRRLIGEDIELVTVLEPELGRVKADPGQLEQVIMNLAVNARDAMPQGGRLTIKTENVTLHQDRCQLIPEARPGKFVCLSVEDTGAGMGKDILQHIFEPFFSTRENGTGLGLAVVYGIVRQHEGWINVYSEPGRGSTFEVYLPTFSVEPKEGEIEETISLEGLQGRGQRILVVEDDEGVRALVRRVLGQNGYVVFEAASAEEAVAIFEREGGDFHLILSDVVLPDAVGLQLVDYLLSRKPALRVLLSSGYTDRKSQWALIHERGFPFLQKPYASAELLLAIREAIGLR